MSVADEIKRALDQKRGVSTKPEDLKMQIMMKAFLLTRTESLPLKEAFDRAVADVARPFSLEMLAANFDLGAMFAEVVEKKQDAEEEYCRECGEDNTGGDGYDGLCGNCADRAYSEEE